MPRSCRGSLRRMYVGHRVGPGFVPSGCTKNSVLPGMSSATAQYQANSSLSSFCLLSRIGFLRFRFHCIVFVAMHRTVPLHHNIETLCTLISLALFNYCCNNLILFLIGHLVSCGLVCLLSLIRASARSVRSMLAVILLFSEVGDQGPERQGHVGIWRCPCSGVPRRPPPAPHPEAH